MIKFILAFLLTVFSFLNGEKESQTVQKTRKTICLNMIVKDEKDVIERCLESVKPFIDYWVIFDTGSTDGTQEVIRNFLKEIPGELHERPWVNFAHNRNEALVAAKDKGDYLLMIDADEILDCDRGFTLPYLSKNFYTITLRQVNAADACRVALINTRFDWKWGGVLHEVLLCPEAKNSEHLPGIKNICNTAIGARSKVPTELKYMRDAEVLERGLKEEPENSRYMFYLGVSYLASCQYERAERAFTKRINMPSIDVQETYQAIYNKGISFEKMGSLDEAIETYFLAHQFRPTRAEPLFRIATLYRKQNKILLGYLMARYALSFPYPQGDVCIEYMAYDYQILIEFANCALLLGKFHEGLDACTKLLQNPHLPEELKPSVIANYELAKKHVSLDFSE